MTTSHGTRLSELSAAKQALVQRRLSGAQTSPVEVIARRPGTGSVPLSPAQRGLWLINEMLADNASYSVHRAMWLRGTLDVTVLRRALDALVGRHDMLRTTVRGDGQMINQPAAAYLVVGEVPGSGAAERRTRALEQARREVSTGFDLSSGPLLRVRLFRIDPAEHLLVINMHHMVTDGWSCGVLARDLGQLYSAYLAGDEARLPQLPIQYGDYAAWQCDRMRGAVLDAELAYWTDALREVPHALELPTDYLRPPRPTYRGRTIMSSLSRELSAAVRRTAAGAGTTVHTVLLTAFVALLSRYCSQRRFAVGSLLAGRDRAETENLIGLFANTVAIPIDLRGEPTFEAALARTHRAVVGALDHPDVSFDQVVTSLAPVRDPSRNTLFQVLFQCVESTEERWNLPGLEIDPAELDNGTAKVDLTLIAVNGPAEIALEFTYATDLFRPETAQRLLGYYASLLGRVLADPARTIGNVPVVVGAERDLVVGAWNDTAVAFPDACVHELFQARAASDPAAVAVIGADGSAVCYGELNARANQVAHYLRSLGVGPEVVVGLCANHSVELFVGLWAILKAGAAYLPLDPAHPPARARFMLADSGVSILVTVASLRTVIPEDFTGRVLCLDRDRAEFAGCPDADPAPLATPDNLVYVMYTSGSTGRPKGVLVTHRGVANYLLWCVDGYGLTGRSGAPMVGSIAFDLSVPNLLLPLIGGKDVTLLGEEDPIQDLVELVQRPGDFSLLKITPGHLDALRRLLPARARIDSVRTYVVGADEVRPETVAAWQRVAPNARIINEYGPTETVVGCSVYEIGPDFDPTVPVSIGRPIANLRMYVLDEWGQLVPPGVVGELYIGGVGVARGYGNRPGLTAERFLPDPYDPAPGARMYRTGDLARQRRNGDIDFLGRIDHQVKIRGYRVELGEVEARLLAHPAVSEAVVVCRDVGEHRQLIAYVVLGAGEAVDPLQVKSYIAAVLPDYMVPAMVMMLDRMPLTTGNKVDRAALPDPAGVADESPDRVAGPRTPMEATLARIWGGALGVDRVGVHDNFFALGGDSLLSIRVAGDARRAGLMVTPALMFSHQTVAELAVALSTTDLAAESRTRPEPAGGDGPPTPDFPLAGLSQPALDRLAADQDLAGVTDVYRLSPLQTGMLFQSVAEPGRGDYVEQFIFSLDGPLDPAALRAAWQQVTNRHDALRTRFAWRGLPHPVQLVGGPVEVDWQELDWRDVAGPDRSARLAALLEADRTRGFPLHDAPPHRYRLIRTGPAEHRLVWTFHHVMLDGWSMPIIFGELMAIYAAVTAGAVLPVLPEPVGPRRYAAWLAGQDPVGGAAFWRESLTGVTGTTPLPVVASDDGEPRRFAGGERVGTASYTLSVGETEQVRGFARAHRITVGIVLQAAWGLLLARQSGRPDVVFGTTSSGRSDPAVELDRVVGMLMNTVPTRMRVTDEPIGDWLRGRHGMNVGAQQYEHWSLADIARAAGLPGRPLFDSIFVFESFQMPEHAAPSGLRISLDQARRQSGYPLVLEASLHDRVNLVVEADRARVIHDGVADEILTAYLRVLAELMAPEARLADLAPALDPRAPIAAVSATSGQPPVADYRAPQDGAECVLAEIWADVLRLPRIGVDDDFLDLGGDSIQATQIVARARDAGLPLRPRDLYLHPTVARLAAHAAGSAPAAAAPGAASPPHPPAAQFRLAGLDEVALGELLSTLDLAEVEEIYRLTPTQVGMLFQRLATRGEDIYFRQRIVELQGELDVAAFRASWQHVVDRHPALRTRFVWDGLPHPVQVVSRHVPVTIDERDARGVPEPERARWLDELLAQERARGIDLGAAAPQRFVLVRTGANSHRFILNTHHLLLDGWSYAIISRELIDVYTAVAAGRTPPDAGHRVPLRPYYEWLATRSRDVDAEYWRRTFDGWTGATPLPLAQAVGQAIRGGEEGAAQQRRAVPGELTDRLRRLARDNRVTLHTLLRCAWGLLLVRHAGGPAAVFGTTLAGRPAEVADIEHMVGMLMNTLPTVVRVDRAETVGDWLRREHEAQLELDDHAHCTLSEARRAGRVTGGPMFESLFTFQTDAWFLPPASEDVGAAAPDASLAWVDLEPPVGATGYPLVVTAELGETLSVAVKYERDRYDAASVALIIEQYLGLLERLAEAGSTAAVAALAPPAGRPGPPDSAEQVIHQIWRSVLGAEEIGRQDDFFELGGDSILAFEVVARARRAGLSITVQDMVEGRTIAGLAAILDGTGTSPTPAGPTPSVGFPKLAGETNQRFLPRLRPDAPELLAAMARHTVPGASVAIVERGQLVRAWGQGVIRAGGAESVVARTAFRACSISKHVAAVGVLRLVQDGLLDLDADVREYQRAWRLPVPPGTPPVTLRHLLSHTAGLNPTPSIGYRRDEPVPSLLDLLTGAPPARSAPVRMELTPGAQFRYARAHYLVIQQVVTDVTGRAFDELIRALVLEPLGMVDSSFDQSFPLGREGLVAFGHGVDTGSTSESWPIYPELAASGLWTTPTDLARLSIEILRAGSGRSGGTVLSSDLATEMLRAIPGIGYGLGSIAVAHTGRHLFGHIGDDLGYQCLSLANLDDGSGVSIMANFGGAMRFIIDLLTELDFSLPQTWVGPS
jgi:amino acid adenylation domain-containing protein